MSENKQRALTPVVLLTSQICCSSPHSRAGTHTHCGGFSTVGGSAHKLHTGTPSEVSLMTDGRFPTCAGPQPTLIDQKHFVMLLCWHTCARTFPSLIPITHFSLYRLESILTSLYLLLRAFSVTGSWEAEVLVGFLER